MEFSILGPLRVLDGGRDLTPGRAKQRALLAMLLLHRNQVVGSDRLVEALWGETPPASAPTALHGHVSALRKLLGAEPEVLFRTVRALERLVKAAPFKRFAAERDAKLYVTFLARKAKSIPKLPLRSPKEALEVFALEGLEVFLVSRRKKNGFYGFPNELTERALGVPTTSRNWSTVTKIVEFAKKGSAG